jgi:hypothetical protein
VHFESAHGRHNDTTVGPQAAVPALDVQELRRDRPEGDICQFLVIVFRYSQTDTLSSLHDIVLRMIAIQSVATTCDPGHPLCDHRNAKRRHPHYGVFGQYNIPEFDF